MLQLENKVIKLVHNMYPQLRAIPFEKLVAGVSGARLKNAAGWSENSSEITAGWSDGPFFALR